MTRAPRRVDIPIYNGRLYVASSEAEWDALRRKFPDLPVLSSTGLTVAGMVRYSTGELVWTASVCIDVPDHAHPKTGEVDWGSVFVTIAHEAAHAAAMMLVDWLEHEVTGTDEPFPYLVGWYFKAIMEAVSKAHAPAGGTGKTVS